MFINEIRKIPFFRLIVPFIIGIIYKIKFPFPYQYLYAGLILVVASTILYGYYYNKKTNYHKRWVMGFLISLSLFLAGAMTVSIQNKTNNNFSSANKFTAKLIEPIKETKKSIRLILEIENYLSDTVWVASNEKVIVYAKRDSLSALLKYGDLITFNADFKAIKNSGNPNEFDYKEYLANKNIHYQTYLNTGNWKLVAKTQGNIIYATAYKLREKLLEIYKSKNITGDEFAILAALTLGVKDYLSPEIMRTYSTSGAMHILAVSGLHVGIIYLLLNSMLFFMRKNTLVKASKAVILIVFIWLFALITGLSPSVTRASIMLSFIIVGNASGRRPSVYNSIAVSAFLILLFKPLAILHVGFQLSYLAVLAIIYFQPKIYRLLNPQNVILDKIWALTAVSIAAQIGTFPISIYYFHKFPSYFFITNLVAIPAAYMIIVLAIALLVFNFLPFISDIIAYALKSTIAALNYSTLQIENLPVSSINQISFSAYESIALYLIMLAIAFYMINNNKKYVFYSLALFLLFASSKNYRQINAYGQTMFIVFNSKSTPVIGFKHDKNFTIFTDSSFSENKKHTGYLLDNFLTNKFIKDTMIVQSVGSQADNQALIGLYIKKKYLAYNGFRAVLLNDGDLNKMASTSKLKTDIVVLSKGFSSNVDRLNELFIFETLVMDATIPYWQEKTILRDCADLGINVYNVKELGAYIKEF
ncbi:MAG: hypothetical protein B6I20_00585 [Bacteroidetes bacterium 4572_117]|nr:MAG: hypothetical protein B6I20_00585 [Bacteroidetes bacterium 4572_117]